MISCKARFNAARGDWQIDIRLQRPRQERTEGHIFMEHPFVVHNQVGWLSRLRLVAEPLQRPRLFYRLRIDGVPVRLAGPLDHDVFGVGDEFFTT